MPDDAERVGDWSPDRFRAEGIRAIEWVARYLEEAESRPVLSRVRPGQIRASLPPQPPLEPESFDSLLSDLDDTILPGVTHWNHPGFLAYFGITGSGPGILGELVSAAFNTNAMLWRTNPASTELEQQVLGWLLEMCDLPREWFGQIVDLGSTSAVLALAAAREACPYLEAREDGLALHGTPRLRVYTSVEAHSSVEKAAILLGLGRAGVRKIAVDDRFRMRADLLAAAIAEDRETGWLPLAVAATIGTTSTTSIDPVEELAAICRREKLWLHVDAAYAGSAAILPECRHHFRGAGEADSYYFNPHKWLFVPIDCSVFYTRHPDTLRRAFQLVPDYLKTSETDAVNLMDYGFQLGRRFRALKLWWVIRSFGVHGLQARLRRAIELARALAERIDAHPRFDLLAPVDFSVVCFHARWPELSAEEEDAANEALLDRLNASGDVFLSATRIRGRYALRVAIGNLRTEARHVDRCWELLLQGISE
ncbi:MAG: pyridoxal-dependent decarboxylase [Candidatus Eisenbacteria bacterium]